MTAPPRRLAVALMMTMLGVAASAAPPTAAQSATPRRSVSVATSSAGGHGLQPLTIAPETHLHTYDRRADFGGWISQHGCQDTRAVFLVRASSLAVTFTSVSDCVVKTGRWTDPWSGVTTTVAHDLQFDHTVPLENAWVSGAWSWTHARRVAYANDLADSGHLVAILTHENESKGDDGPDQWRPPNRATWCRYALVWDRIKAKWHLSATPSEWNALVAMTSTC